MNACNIILTLKPFIRIMYDDIFRGFSVIKSLYALYGHIYTILNPFEKTGGKTGYSIKESNRSNNMFFF